MDVMKAVKNVLSGAFILALIAMIFSSPQVKADGVHGVRETAREILVEVPKFCRPLTVVWEAQWEQAASNKDALDAIVSSMQKDSGTKVVPHYLHHDALKLASIWRAGETIHIPKFDAKGNPIKIGFLSILALGGGEKLLNKNNWVFIFADGRVVDISPPVNVGTWGKCT
jgi:hypothetical protein